MDCVVFCDEKPKEVDVAYAERVINAFRKITGWKVEEGTRIHNDLMEFSRGYSNRKRDANEVAVIFMIAKGIGRKPKEADSDA